jgi:hypothetical protein
MGRSSLDTSPRFVLSRDDGRFSISELLFLLLNIIVLFFMIPHTGNCEVSNVVAAE